MNAKQVILFDLDGTLTDTSPGIMRTFRRTLLSFYIEENDSAALRGLIGPPLADSFRRHYGFSEEKAWSAVEKYREIYTADGIFDNVIYDGMTDLLKMLTKQGKTLIVATSKLEPHAKLIIDDLGLSSYFACVAGSNVDGSRARKSEVINHALSAAGVTDPASAVMVGDTRFDIIGAREAGIDSIGVLYGFGTAEELQAEGCTYIAADMPALTSLLLGEQF